ncbi:MAG: hypothetical protein V3V08_17825 [Nannocystaceae bacterium]
MHRLFAHASGTVARSKSSLRGRFLGLLPMFTLLGACGPGAIATSPDDSVGATLPAAEDPVGGSLPGGVNTESPGSTDDGWSDDTEADPATWTDALDEFCVPGVGDCAPGWKCQPVVAEDDACCVDSAMCVPLVGDRQLGEPCLRERYSDDCARDLFCFSLVSGKVGSGTCVQLCDGLVPESCEENDPGLEDHVCVAFSGGWLPVCKLRCHPLRSVCEERDGCYPIDHDLYACSEPFPVMGDPTGIGCGVARDCNPGQVCIPAEEHGACGSHVSCCAPYCDLLADDALCEDPLVCQPFLVSDEPPVDPYLDVGVCVVGSR